MNHEFSLFGRQLAGVSGIGELMEDLGNALASGGPDLCMLGGGQPAHIPAVNARWRQRMEDILAEPGALERVLANYDPPRGNPKFIAALAALFHREFGWDLGPENIAITSGGQTAFFFLFNLLAGEMPDGRRKKILLPLVPEYIGYANQGAGGDLFRAVPPKIEITGPHEFKYRVDFEALEIGDDIAAICVSRPTNPTGNVLTDGEIARLSELAKTHGIPLIIDNAYGAPFPNIIFTEAAPVWDEHVILTLSLSKLGLPGTRSGIVVAHPRIAAALAAMSAIIGLANPNIGQAIALPLVESGEILRIANETVRPFYMEKSRQARDFVAEIFGDSFDYYIHRSEGALFLWLWFPGLPIPSRELYERLKRRGVLIISGHYFFFGHDDASWRHRHECLRMTFTMDESVVRRGIQAIGEEVRRAHREASAEA
ncbi:MAG: valine--pyruvate transaminase [Verrucomicrobia bacterium]|nr:MAG: valine--pyruvate transaminase [Verrucomicrobiota bacterium]TAE88381.1 MAG: valine--pyruvate transaminase [Verrucomicrobiota bacterium]TAF26835.1 MAG: valine--pyruvate transaminase [Verrucomicrobiota bacterium]TAF42093.1 MAG: valine--pyruvate transaminase [Verrucomicrobiota bacterium]